MRNLSQVVVLQRCCIQDYRVDKVDRVDWVDRVDKVDKNSQILGSNDSVSVGGPFAIFPFAGREPTEPW